MSTEAMISLAKRPSLFGGNANPFLGTSASAVVLLWNPIFPAVTSHLAFICVELDGVQQTLISSVADEVVEAAFPTGEAFKVCAQPAQPKPSLKGYTAWLVPFLFLDLGHPHLTQHTICGCIVGHVQEGPFQVHGGQHLDS